MKTIHKMLVAIMAIFAITAASAEDLEVMHWWTSGGEAAAVAQFAEAFNATGNTWVDAAIVGGEGSIDDATVLSTASARALVDFIDVDDGFVDGQGVFWERTWGLMPNQQTVPAKNLDPDAVWLPVNDGGWYLVKVPEGTLVVYHVRSVIGGNIPDNAAAQWAYMTLGGMMKNVHGRATTWVDAHYVAGHEVMKRPDGTPVPLK